MGQPRATTIQQRFGFRDNDLKTPLHDEMLLWLDDNIYKIVEEIVGYDTWILRRIANVKEKMGKYVDDFRVYHSEHEPLLSTYDFYADPATGAEKWGQQMVDWRAFGKVLDELELPEPPPSIPDFAVHCVWEKSITTGSGNVYTVGFVDLVACITFPIIKTNVHIAGINDCSQYHDKKLPKWIVDKPTVHQSKMHNLYFEIKTTIKSLGELVRQIRMYQTYVNGKFIVVCPDARFKEPLRSQGIGFVKYQSEIIQNELW